MTDAARAADSPLWVVHRPSRWRGYYGLFVLVPMVIAVASIARAVMGEPLWLLLIAPSVLIGVAAWRECMVSMAVLPDRVVVRNAWTTVRVDRRSVTGVRLDAGVRGGTVLSIVSTTLENWTVATLEK